MAEKEARSWGYLRRVQSAWAYGGVDGRKLGGKHECDILGNMR